MKWLWGMLIVSLCLCFFAGCGSAAPEKPIPSLIPPTNTPTQVPTNTLAPTKTRIPTPVPSITPERYDYHFVPALSAADCLVLDLPEEACTGVSANQDWTPVIREFEGVEMVLVPAGCFGMGYDFGFDEEKPAHEVCLDRPYWIDRTEVTVQQYADFLNDIAASEKDYHQRIYVWLSDQWPNRTPHVQLRQVNGVWKPKFREDDHPQEYVSWSGAYDICAWRGAKLPTEAEWEYAARGPDNLLFPWGNEYSAKLVVRGRSYPHAGSKPEGASWVGALDMAGSEFEWTSSLYWPYPYDPEDGREDGFGVGVDSQMVFRGSALYHDLGIDNVSSTARFEALVDDAYWYHGARCARSVE